MQKPTYEKCKHCHLFIEANLDGRSETGAVLAANLHLHRGDDADEAIDETHEAEPSGMVATLETWKAYGPQQMRERFIGLLNTLETREHYPPDRVGVGLMMGEPWERARTMSWAGDRLLEAVREADAAGEGDSNDSEISALSGALEEALSRWPEITVEARA